MDLSALRLHGLCLLKSKLSLIKATLAGTLTGIKGDIPFVSYKGSSGGNAYRDKW